jgi:uncharacterized membrane protein
MKTNVVRLRSLSREEKDEVEEKVLQISEVCMSKNGPNFLKVYVIPVLLLNLAVGGWGVIATHKAQGMMISLGYAVIVTVSLYLYLLYLGRYLS